MGDDDRAGKLWHRTGDPESSPPMLRVALRSEPWPNGKHDPRPCVVCGNTWIPWAGSRLRCHARCLLTPEGLERVRRRVAAEPTRSLVEFASEFDLPVNLLRALFHAQGVSR